MFDGFTEAEAVKCWAVQSFVVHRSQYRGMRGGFGLGFLGEDPGVAVIYRRLAPARNVASWTLTKLDSSAASARVTPVVRWASSNLLIGLTEPGRGSCGNASRTCKPHDAGTA